MASGRSLSWNITSAEQKKVGLLTTYQCRICKKFKPPTLFSNKELNTYRWKVTNRVPVDATSAKLRCRNCSGDQTQELQCVGPCNLWKCLDDFSKNQRRHPDNAWCLTCTQWKEANEPGITPLAPPNASLAPDEERAVAQEEAGFASYTVDFEGGADSDGEYESGGPGYLYSSMASMGIGGTADQGEGSTAPRVPGTAAGDRPARIVGAKIPVTTNNSLSSLSNPYDTRTVYGSEKDDLTTDIPGDDNSKTTSKNKLIWTVADRKRRGAAIAYNGWDNSGQVHTRFRPLSTTDATSTSISSNTGAEGLPTSHRGWAKGLGRANQPTQFPPISRPVRQNNLDDDDDKDEL